MFRLLVLGFFLGAPSEKDAWQLLKSLAGDWQATTSEGKSVPISYQVVSEGSAVMETMKTADGAPYMITMYHRDGTGLMLTHYCAAGNQPRMRAAAVAEGGKKIVFKFLDVTNLANPGADHIRDLTITFTSPKQVVQEWTARKGGKDSKTVFTLVR